MGTAKGKSRTAQQYVLPPFFLLWKRMVERRSRVINKVRNMNIRQDGLGIGVPLQLYAASDATLIIPKK